MISPRATVWCRDLAGTRVHGTTRYIGQALEVRGDSRLVHLYHHGDLIKVHASQPAGGRATDYADYPA